MKRFIAIGFLLFSLLATAYPQVRRQPSARTLDDRAAVERLIEDYIKANAGVSKS
jgi:hypothetical protein